MVLEPSSCGAWVRRICVCLVTGAGIALTAAPSPAQANCYELIGCTDRDYYKRHHLEQLGCQPLWDVRNTIYKENGYCFHTAKAIKYFGNAGCKYDNAGDVPLNKFERYNVAAIKKVEKSKGCN